MNIRGHELPGSVQSGTMYEVYVMRTVCASECALSEPGGSCVGSLCVPGVWSCGYEVCTCALCVRELILECELREVKSPRLALGLDHPTRFSPAGPRPLQVQADRPNPPSRNEVTSPTKSTRGWRPLVTRRRPRRSPEVVTGAGMVRPQSGAPRGRGVPGGPSYSCR